ncbi:PID-CTERM protein-sorting domain-containing protein [Hymenobacter yonginensis]|uniref:VPDSG-CTERM protein sorting domain-containing protein n=1 Tax=Hymenobacter yonginensis TaxID=748197 RepID=A0ABY7PRW9_9BACT|nr:hypothetical protein [Hymenobacter yonginensis]WBO85592.1 hypothetical protein O9Z63_04945 [Hymenobacter yonginensis]
MKLSSHRFRLLTSAPLLAALLLGMPAQAQGPGTGGPTPDPNSPTAVPLDGGASLLLLAGGALALRRLRRSTANEHPDDAG